MDIQRIPIMVQRTPERFGGILQAALLLPLCAEPPILLRQSLVQDIADQLRGFDTLSARAECQGNTDFWQGIVRVLLDRQPEKALGLRIIADIMLGKTRDNPFLGGFFSAHYTPQPAPIRAPGPTNALSRLDEGQ